MFDSSHYLNVLKLRGVTNDNSKVDLDKINGYPLDEVKRISELEELGCDVHDYLEFFKLFSAEDEPDHAATYLLAYQCYEGTSTP